ncbi:MAG: mannose-1-phosphate guanylyltransferase [bacterium P3]|nr:MAG: mannose-1-phosphate guanylyltransferase [bacterium P3]KWW42492.1 MAG: mannose-1-phosphate guanylyltransferase [bacterium F083]
MMKELVRRLCIESQSSILAALKQMDSIKRKLLIVLENGHYLSLLSVGDIQRAIIRGDKLEQPVTAILRDKTNVATIHDDRQEVERYVKEHKTEFMPIIDDDGNLADVIFWDELFHTRVERVSPKFNLPVIIMAGGKGTRLRPLTNVLPKPLIPIGEQTMMEDIMDRFVECGCHDFYVSVNYKAEIIKRYLDNLDKPQYHISYFQEDKPLGTAGSLHLLKDKINDTFFVSNCDIIVDEDYGEILSYHRENRNEITVVAAIKNMAIPYGTLETKEEGLLSDIKEKPEYTFKINTGMYILEPSLIKEIPEDEFYHITYLIEKLMKEGRRVGVYPINEGSWIDVGNWDEYLKYIRK